MPGMHCALAIVSASPNKSDFSIRREHARIALGLRQMAYTVIKHALEDYGGRSLCGDSPAEQREWAALAMRWLRDARSMRPFSFAWCCNILDIQPAHVQRNGLACLKGVSLSAWRHVRTHRNDDRTKRLTRVMRRCGFCRKEYLEPHVG